MTNKVVKNSVKIALGFQKYLEVGNIHAYRDWGHAKDYVKAMHKILNYKNLMIGLLQRVKQDL